MYRGDSPDGPFDIEVNAELIPASPDSLSGGRYSLIDRTAQPGATCQFERKGYFCVDPDSQPGGLVFNMTIPLRDTWAKIENK